MRAHLLVCALISPWSPDFSSSFHLFNAYGVYFPFNPSVGFSLSFPPLCEIPPLFMDFSRLALDDNFLFYVASSLTVPSIIPLLPRDFLSWDFPRTAWMMVASSLLALIHNALIFFFQSAQVPSPEALVPVMVSVAKLEIFSCLFSCVPGL